MSEIKHSKGIILRKFDYSNTSIIFHLMTPDSGIIHIIARGAKSNKSPSRGKLDIFNQIDCHYITSGKTDLHPLKECSVINRHQSIEQNIYLFFTCSLMFEIINCFPWDNSDTSNIYYLIEQIFISFNKDNQNLIPQTLVFFETKILTLLGYCLDTTTCCNCGKKIIDFGLPMVYDQPGFSCRKCITPKNKTASDNELDLNRLSEITEFFYIDNPTKLKQLEINDKNAYQISSALIFLFNRLSGKTLKSAKMIDKLFNNI